MTLSFYTRYTLMGDVELYITGMCANNELEVFNFTTKRTEIWPRDELRHRIISEKRIL